MTTWSKKSQRDFTDIRCFCFIQFHRTALGFFNEVCCMFMVILFPECVQFERPCIMHWHLEGLSYIKNVPCYNVTLTRCT